MENSRFKFRVWSNKHNRYIVDSHYPIGSDHIIVIQQDGKVYNLGLGDYEDDSNVHSWGVIEEFADCVVEQCTGWRDKRLKPIYENDIVKACFSEITFIGTVVFNNDKGFGVIYQETKNSRLFMPFLSLNDIEIIGNIHEQKDNK